MHATRQGFMGMSLAFGSAMMLVSPASATLIDDFERDVLEDNPAWATGGSGGAGNAIVDDGTGNRALSFFEDGDANAFTQYARIDLGANAIAEGDTGTLFYRVRVEDAEADGLAHLFGLSNVGTGDRNSDYLQTQQVALPHGDEGKWTFRQFSGSLGDGTHSVHDVILDEAQWYNVWLVADNDEHTYQVYLNEDPGDGTLLDADAGDLLSISGVDTFNFKDSSAFPAGGDLTHFMAHAGNASDSDGVWLDDLHLMPGQNLTNPIPEPGSLALLGLGGLMLLKRRRA